MSEPKIIDILNPGTFEDAIYPLYHDPLLRDGLYSPVAVSDGGASDGAFVYAFFGDNVTWVDYTGVLWINHNCLFGEANYTVNRHSLSISGKTTHEVTDPTTGQRHTLVKFPKMNTYKLGVGYASTQPANQLKTIGEFILFNENTLTITRDFSSYEEKWREVVKQISLNNGGIHRVITLSQAGKNLRYECAAQFNFMSESDVEAWKVLKQSGNTFWFMPESETNPHKIYKCHFSGPWNVKATSQYKGAGYTISVGLKEVK